MRITSIAASLTIAALLLGTGSAVAGSGGLPEPDDPTIDAPRTLGGIEIGDRLQDANHAWGNTGRCKRGTCSYGNFSSRRGAARIVRENGSVSIVQIAAGVGPAPDDRVGVSFEGPLLNFRTTVGGIGLGSTLSELKDAYPQVELLPGPGRVYSLDGRGRQVMTFANPRSDAGQITEIVLRRTPER